MNCVLVTLTGARSFLINFATLLIEACAGYKDFNLDASGEGAGDLLMNDAVNGEGAEATEMHEYPQVND